MQRRWFLKGLIASVGAFLGFEIKSKSTAAAPISKLSRFSAMYQGLPKKILADYFKFCETSYAERMDLSFGSQPGIDGKIINDVDNDKYWSQASELDVRRRWPERWNSDGSPRIEFVRQNGEVVPFSKHYHPSSNIRVHIKNAIKKHGGFIARTKESLSDNDQSRLDAWLKQRSHHNG